VSGKNNVNPDYYKLAGRGRPDEEVPPATRSGAAEKTPTRKRKKGAGPPPNLIPGAPPVGERPESDETTER
jgi:hypothetical protein